VQRRWPPHSRTGRCPTSKVPRPSPTRLFGRLRNGFSWATRAPAQAWAEVTGSPTVAGVVPLAGLEGARKVVTTSARTGPNRCLKSTKQSISGTCAAASGSVIYLILRLPALSRVDHWIPSVCAPNVPHRPIEDARPNR
jgi:hypothetical protein